MRTTRLLVTLLTIAAATLLFYVLVHQISGVWLDVALRPEVAQALERSLEDQKKLRALDRANSAQYRQRFEESRRLLNRIEVIRMNREAMLRRFEIILVVLFAIAVTAAATVWWMRQRRVEERKRREFAARLSSWQEAARRHAHEIRTPLTAARLEVDRLVSLSRASASDDELRAASESVFEELDRLARFTKEFSSFGAIGEPVLQPEALDRIVSEFCATFANAWPGLQLWFEPPAASPRVNADRDLLRQVLVNLCTNSSRAAATRVMFNLGRDGDAVALDVTDDGSGIPPSVRPRIFDPYVTTRKIGEGMGLGLAIARKILLDHGGDLRLVDTSPAGTTFRLVIPSAARDLGGESAPVGRPSRPSHPGPSLTFGMTRAGRRVIPSAARDLGGESAPVRRPSPPPPPGPSLTFGMTSP